MSVTVTTSVIDPTSGGKLAVNAELGIAYPLTTCCDAAAKGGYDYNVFCKACYEDVSSAFGMCWMIDELPQAIRDAVMAEVTS